MSFNLATMLRESASATPDKTLVHFAGHEISYAQVDEMSGRLATQLIGLGLERGDKVAVQLPNVPHFLFAYFGILKAGMVMVPLNPLLVAPEVAYHLHDSDSRVLITFETFAGEALKGAAQIYGMRTYVLSLSGAAAPDGASAFEQLLAGEDTRDIVAAGADDTAVVLYTSGTTGKPKGAELTHFQLFMNCTIAGELFGYRPDDRMLAVLPLFHVFGLSSVLNIAVRFGGSMTLVPRFDTAAVIDAMESTRCTIFAGVPTMYFALLQANIADRDLSSLRVGLSGGAAIPGEVIRAFEDKFPGVFVLEGYGLSESASTTTFNISAEERRVLSIGKPIWGVELKIVAEDGSILGDGPDQVGEIVIRGHNIMKGYYKNPKATAEALRDGWFSTGDLGYRDSDGFYFIVDRKKDLVIRGGFNVYPREIEEVLYSHTAVAEAAVIGKADERLGEEVVAIISLKPGAEATPEEVIAFSKERLAAYKYPREVRIIAELPKGPTGKILKKDLRLD
jgi:long-chain acyl-CoA synthetase